MFALGISVWFSFRVNYLIDLLRCDLIELRFVDYFNT